VFNSEFIEISERYTTLGKFKEVELLDENKVLKGLMPLERIFNQHDRYK
jgi:hypothetical protein